MEQYKKVKDLHILCRSFILGWLMGLEPTTTGITIQGSAPKADALTGLRYAPTEELEYTDTLKSCQSNLRSFFFFLNYLFIFI